MPIVFIEQMSPLKVGIRDEDGKVLAECQADTVDCRDLDWVLDRAAQSPNNPKPPPRGKPFRLENGVIELKTRSDEERGGDGGEGRDRQH